MDELFDLCIELRALRNQIESVKVRIVTANEVSIGLKSAADSNMDNAKALQVSSPRPNADAEELGVRWPESDSDDEMSGFFSATATRNSRMTEYLLTAEEYYKMYDEKLQEIHRLQSEWLDLEAQHGVLQERIRDILRQMSTDELLQLVEDVPIAGESVK